MKKQLFKVFFSAIDIQCLSLVVFLRKKIFCAERCAEGCVKWIFLLEKQNYFWLFQNIFVSLQPKINKYIKLIGRKIEQEELRRLFLSEQPEFAVVYGRRRVGKTFLIRSVFKDNFTFYTTGIARGTRKEQLRHFGQF